jgi:predicted ferric reductase
MNSFIGSIIKISDEIDGVKTFSVQTPCGFNYHPGQFVMVEFDGGDNKQLGPKPFTISGSDEGSISLTIKKVGEFTSRLFELDEGDLLTIKGPYGKVHFDEFKNKNLVFVTIGVAITPFINAIRFFFDRKNYDGNSPSTHIELFYGSRDRDHIIFNEELSRLSRENKQLVVKNFLSDETESVGLSENEFLGRIPVSELSSIVDEPLEKIWFVCGSTAFKEECKTKLLEQGIPEKNIFFP